MTVIQTMTALDAAAAMTVHQSSTPTLSASA